MPKRSLYLNKNLEENKSSNKKNYFNKLWFYRYDMHKNSDHDEISDSELVIGFRYL